MTDITSLLSHYRKGTLRRARKMFGLPFNSPFMRYKEIAVMEEVIQKLKPSKVLEFGCGLSTLYFPTKLKLNAEWHAIEHNEKWFKDVQRQISNPNLVKLYHIPVDSEEVGIEDEHKFKSYVDFPSSLGKFDLILVDGVARKECITKAKQLLNKNGLLIVHDSNRSAYHSLLKTFKHWMIMEDFRKTSGGFGFATKDKDIKEYIALENHRGVWKIDNAIQNFSKFKFLLGKKTRPYKESFGTKSLDNTHDKTSTRSSSMEETSALD